MVNELTCGGCYHYEPNNQIVVGPDAPDPNMGKCLQGPPQLTAVGIPTQAGLRVEFICRYPELPPEWQACHKWEDKNAKA